MKKFDLETEPESLPVEFLPEERRVLLEDIGWLCLAASPASASEPLGVTSESNGNALLAASSPFLRLKRLEQFAAQAETLLPAVARQPHSALTAEFRTLPAERARGDAATMHQVMRSPAAMSALLSPAPRTVNVRERHAALTHDTPPNRLLAGIAQRMENDANALALLAAFCEDEAAEVQARRLAQIAQEWRRLPFCRDTAPMPMEQVETLLPVCQSSAPLPYKILFGHWAEYTGTAEFDWSGVASLTLSSRALWQIYEIWCFGQIAQALEQMGATRLEGERIRITAEGLHLVAATGRASCLRFAWGKGKRANSTLRLYYQPLFISANRRVNAPEFEPDALADSMSDYQSRSHAMQPDYALQGRGKLIVLDAKMRTYSAPRSEQDDINKMHAYRDGIIRKGSAGRTSAVTAAWSVFAGIPNADFSLQAVRAYPNPTETEPFGSGEIGAIQLRPLAPRCLPLLTRLLETLGMKG